MDQTLLSLAWIGALIAMTCCGYGALYAGLLNKWWWFALCILGVAIAILQMAAIGNAVQTMIDVFHDCTTRTLTT